METSNSDNGSLDHHDYEDSEAIPNDNCKSDQLVIHHLSWPPEDMLVGFQVAAGFLYIAENELAEPALELVNLEPIQPEGEVSTRVSDPEPLFIESKPIHTSQRQKCRDMSGLSQCLCGNTAKLNKDGLIQC